MRLSIIVPVLNSHEVVRRQVTRWERMGLPHDDVEVILIDDGSDPPIEAPVWVRMIRTGDTRPWTWALARNRGAREAKGERLLLMDVDHILSSESLLEAMWFQEERLQFLREFGVLDEDGNLDRSIPTLLAYGLDPERIPKRGVALSPHPNMFAMKKEVFWELGGYREDLIHRSYPQGEDSEFKGRWNRAQEEKGYRNHPYRPTIYMFPNGKYCGGANPPDVDADPKGLFHTLTRKTHRNPFWNAHA